MDECAGQLNETFVKEIVGLAALTEPEFFQHVVCFVEKLLIKTFKITEVMRVQTLAVQRLDHLCDARALLAHGGTIGAEQGSEQC